MKKGIVFIGCLALANYLNAGSLTSTLNSTINSSLNDIFGTINNFSGGCYESSASVQIEDVDLCQYTTKLNSLDICSAMPSIPGFTKKTKKLNLNSYCSASAVNKAKNTVSQAAIYDSDFNPDITTYPAGQNVSTFYTSTASAQKIVQQDSIAKKAFVNNDQRTLKMIIDTAKVKGGSINNVTVDDLPIPKTQAEYMTQRDQLADIQVTNFDQTRASDISAAMDGASDSAIDQYVSKKNALISAGTAKRIGAAVDVARKSDDFALPTKDQVQYIRADLQPKMIAKIENQINREALISANVQAIDNARIALIGLAGKKAKLMNATFNASAAQSEIDQIIQ